MKTVYKYKIQPLSMQTISIPWDATVLSVKNQNDDIVLYVYQETTEVLKRELKIFVRGTGHNCDKLDIDGFVGTVMLSEGSLAFHVFVNKK